MPKTSRRRRSSSVVPSADINGYSADQLARLPAEVLRLHLASRHLVTSGSKATMAKRLYDALNSSATDSNDASRAPPPATLSANTPPSTNQPTTASAVFPSALQAQLSSLMAQFLQYATPPASISHEAASEAARTTSNLSPASTVHASEQPPPSLAATLSQLSAVTVSPRVPTTVTATSGHSAFTQHTSLPPAIPLNVQPRPQIPTVHTAPAPTYSIQPAPIPTPLPLPMPTSGWIMQQPPYQSIMQPAAHPMTSETLPPVPAQIRQKIIQGEFIDFSVLLHHIPGCCY